MLKGTVYLLSQSGFYIAVHPWLQVAGFVKVGCTTSLEARLNMPSFQTCFTAEWHYHTVFECESQKEALLLEQSVLFCLSEIRVPHRELLQTTEVRVADVARTLAKRLNLTVVERVKPVYGARDNSEPCLTDAGAVRKGEDPGDSSNEGHEREHGPSLASDRNAAHVAVTEEPRKPTLGVPATAASPLPDDACTPHMLKYPEHTIKPYVHTLEVLRDDLRCNRLPIEPRESIDTPQLPWSDSLHGRRAQVGASGTSTASVQTFPRERKPTHDDVCSWPPDNDSEKLPNSGGSHQKRSSESLVCIEPDDYSLSSLRPYQDEAVARVRKELAVKGKTICQMACRCGKTPVAFCLMRDYVRPDNLAKSSVGRALYLVPGLSLLRQTAKKLFSYGFQDVPMLLVGSDPTVVFLDAKRSVCMTTDAQQITDFLLQHSHSVVVSTYHSSPLLEKYADMFSLTVFDECHRVCGSADKTAFNTILSLPCGLKNKRLFLTATPTYDTPIRMSNESLFGGIAYRYYLREGIDAGFVNSFCVRVVLGASMDDMTPYIAEAMRHVDKMLIFCRSIKHAEELHARLSAATPEVLGEDAKPFVAFVAHSKMGPLQVASTLDEFTRTRRCVLFNVRLFQEGVEIPDLNAVFFAAPRYSSRDIIQSVCRPLNKLPNKPISYVFLPAALNTKYRESHPINLRNFSTLVPFTDALMDEDPTLFEYMLDPQKKSYDFNVVGLRSLKLSSEKLHKFVLPAVRRGVRYSCTTQSDRLHRAARLPWKYVFNEMKRIVLECNRYPKTNDAWVVGDTSVSMNLFYRYARRGYALYLAGEQTYLQTYQIRDLESLPQWRRYGLEGPYPWKECLATLAAHLEAHGTAPPLDVHKGGFVGLDATPFERLSGCLMHVNQCDGKSELRLSPEKQRDMDELCSRYGLRWRKKRTAKGTICKDDRTFITDSYVQFKRLLGHVKKYPLFQEYLDKHFPGYPDKHARMENIDILFEGRVPPRHQPMKRAVTKQKKGRARPPKKKLQRSVMCRICRVNVNTADWQAHLLSVKHLAAKQAG